MEKFVHWVADENGKPLHNVDITVNLAGTTTKATLFSDRAGMIPLTNPFKSEVDGSFSFYVAPGRYDIIRSKTGITFDDDDLADIRIGGTGDVVGPASAINNNLAAFDGTTGKLIKDSGNLSADVADAVLKRMFIGDIFSPFVASGLTATVVGTNNKVAIAPGTAYNVQRLHTTTNTVLTVSNTGAIHTEYVSVNTAGELIITTTPRAVDELAVADVSVNATGVATAITDVRQLKLHLKTNGIERMTIDGAGKTRFNDYLIFMKPVNNVFFVGSETAEVVDNSLGFFVAGAGSASSSDGPYFIARGNTFTQYANQRGNIYFVAGVPTTPGTAEGSINFWTGAPLKRVIITKNGNVGIRTTAAGNILTIQQASATDPIADAWITHSLRKGKTILKNAHVLDFDETPVRRWKRKLTKPKLTDFEEVQEEAEEGSVRTREDQLADALEEYTKKKGSKKFNQEQFGVIAEEAPDCLKAYDDTGKLVGINTSAYIGWLHAAVKEQSTTIKDLTTRVQALEQVSTRNRKLEKTL